MVTIVKVAELTKSQIPQPFIERRLTMAEQDLQKAKQELTKHQEEVDYWQGLLEHK